MTRRIVLALALWASAAPAPAPAMAQAPAPDSGGGERVVFLPRYVFHLGAEHLSHDDPRYVWDANYGGELDLVDYVYGRATFYANYETVLGEQLHVFDPNQGNYILGAALSVRASWLEIGGVFHHESRHLSDRSKVQPVDWNMIGLRIGADGTRGRTEIAARGDVRWAIKRSFVDYDWEIAGNVRTSYAVTPRVGLIAGGSLDVLGTDGTVRGTQTGVRAEGGIRLSGARAAVELFLAGERRVDPYPLEFSTASWFSAGFRLVSR